MLKKIINNLLQVKILLIFNIVIFIAKFIFSYKNKFSTNCFEDWSIASNIAKYGVYSEFIEVGSTAYKLPVYPLFLSAIIYLFPKNAFESIIIIQHIIYFFIPILFILIARLFNAEKIGILTGFIFLFSPAYFFYSNIIEVTNVFIPILLIWTYFYLKIYLKNYKTNYIYILFSLITAILFLTQIVVVPISILLIIYLLISKKLNFKNWIYIVVFSSVFYSPWIIRNYIVFDRFIPTKTPVWQNIYLSYTSSVNILDDVKLILDKNSEEIFRLRRHVSEFEMEKIYKRETLKALDGKQNIVLLKMAQNVLLLWYVPSRYYYDNSLKIIFGRKIFVCLLNVFTILSLIYFYKNNKKLFYFSILVFTNFTMPYAIGHAFNTRFKLDFEWVQYFIVSCFVIYKLNSFRLLDLK
jgi:hypothetical protein